MERGGGGYDNKECGVATGEQEPNVAAASLDPFIHYPQTQYCRELGISRKIAKRPVKPQEGKKAQEATMLTVI